MTVCSPAMYTILDAEYDIDTLRDVASHGLASGCGGFIYTSDNVRDEGSFAYFARQCEDITQLKNKLVWAYVELKAQSILQQLED